MNSSIQPLQSPKMSYEKFSLLDELENIRMEKIQRKLIEKAIILFNKKPKKA